MTMPLPQVLIAVAVSAVITLSCRAFPFVIFARKEPPPILRFVEKYIPPMIIAILVVYCMKDIDFAVKPFGLTHLAALVVTVLLHLWKRNSMISIFGGTIFFMVLDKLL